MHRVTKEWTHRKCGWKHSAKGEADALGHARTDQDDRLATVVVHRSDAVTPGGLDRCLDHHLLSLGAPHGSQRWHPAQVELLSVVEDISCSEIVACFFDRLFLRAYSGSGLVMVCWRRLSTILAAFRCTRTVSYSTRRYLFSLGHVVSQPP